MIVKLTSDREEEVEPWQAQINVAAAADLPCMMISQQPRATVFITRY
jgi:hypothetical protein